MVKRKLNYIVINITKEEMSMENKENTNEVEKKRLSVPATVLITIVAALGAIVVARIIYFIFTGV